MLLIMPRHRGSTATHIRPYGRSDFIYQTSDTLRQVALVCPNVFSSGMSESLFLQVNGMAFCYGRRRMTSRLRRAAKHSQHSAERLSLSSCMLI